DTTGPEIWQQTEGRLTHFVCAPGTGGTVSGAGRYLKERNPRIRVIAGDPVGSIYSDYARNHRTSEGHPYKVEGIGGDKIPSALHWDVIDEWISVSDQDAMLMARRLAREEGLFTGGSTGVNIVSALEVARRVNDPEALVVTVLCDTGERYLSKVYNDEWLRENQILEPERTSVGDGGVSWDPLFDKQTTSSIGSIAVSESDPNVIYVGTGEACIRGNISFGDGVYRSNDGGKTWNNVGLKDSRHIGKVIVHPTNPDVAFVAALGYA